MNSISIKPILNRRNVSRQILFLILTIMNCHFVNAQNWKSPIDIAGNYSNGYLTDIDCINSNLGFAVGHDQYNPRSSKILKTTNGGITWSHVYPSMSKILRRISFLDANNGWITGENGCILKTIDGGDTWTDQSIPTKINIIYGISIIDNQKLFVGGDSGLFKSSDGGGSWTRVGNYRNVNSVQFTSSTVGYFLNSTGFYKSNDGGANWVSTAASTSGAIRFNFIDDSFGWIYGWGPGSNPSTATIRKTNDGGNTWTTQPNSADGYLSNGFILSRDTLILVGESGVIMKTSDGGNTWIKSKSAEMVGYYNPFSLLSVKGFSKDNIWIVGAYSIMRKSTDVGTTWVTKNIGSNKTIYSIQYCKTDKTRAFAAGNTVVKSLISGNSGKTWSQTTNPPGAVYSCAYRDLNNLLVSSDSGIYFSNDQGMTWTTKYVNNPPSEIFKMYFFDNSTGWAVGKGGIALKTIDGGQTWTKQTSSTTKYLNSISFATSSNGFAVGDSDLIIKTNDGGASWTTFTGISNPFFNDVLFVSANNGWIVGSDGAVFKTTDGGTSWSKPSLGISSSEILLSIKFTSTTEGWISGARGAIYHTTDGGSTWSKQATNITNDIFSMDFNSDGTGLLSGSYGCIQINKCISSSPSAADTQYFSSGQKISNLTASGSNLKWYSDAALLNSISSTTILTDMSTYYVTQTINGCESDPISIYVRKCSTPIPTGDKVQYFSAGDKLSSLVANGASLKWYLSASSSSPLNISTELIHNKTYFVTQTIDNCESQPFSITAKLNSSQSINQARVENLGLYFDGESIYLSKPLKEAIIDVYSVMGSLVFSSSQISNQISISNLPSGFYIARIRDYQTNLKLFKP